MKALLIGVVVFVLLLVGPLLNVVSGEVRLDRNWRTASHDSAGLAPAPDEHPEALVQVYAARAFGWRGAFAVHTWVAVKPREASHYTVHEVMGWHVRHGGEAVVSRARTPDRHWYGQPPRLLAELRGSEAERVIPRIETLIEEYPYRDSYVMWPGPNSNSFTAYIGRHVPELSLDLPATAIGKDYLVGDTLLGPAVSGGGGQLSFYGLLGFSVSSRSVEFNILGLSIGLRFAPLALKVPGHWAISLS